MPKTNRIGKTEVGENLEPLAGWEELAGIPSSKIQVLFLMLGLCLWAGNARSYQYGRAFIHSFIHSLNTYLLLSFY